MSRQPPLPLSLVNRQRFLDLFYEPDTFDLHKKVSVHLHVLRIDGGEFVVSQLYKELANSTLGYVLSRQNLEKLRQDPGRTVEVVNKVQTQFRKPDAKAGEGGELLLYALLEGHLGAPKVLSKMELKTSPNHYVNGADGVHLLLDDNGVFQLIFGESKMYGDLKKPRSSVKRAVKAAFKSMAEVHKGAFEFDTWLVESELLKETLDPDQINVLASILLPTARGQNPVTKTNAFGVFIGFEVDASTVAFEDLTVGEIEVQLRDDARALIDEATDAISKQIKDRGLGGYHFHIYAVPFLRQVVQGEIRGIENVREDLARALRNDRSDEK
ncbi:HamA C-terminal domain-containing protein [Microbacterium aurugineum]|uniref:DUF1837 domain-containing protein n=1 Tax=Microbacterium aurugineum TaxID=2851642 RepID=A0ABY4J117_9MICO|nr:DUF1837 domain-containing protein [Microbacterium aurugineum]UPL18644.1 DUF1837 domain-containing protein [Microbacterium aurugineum]